MNLQNYHASQFKFGLETEYLLVENSSLKPLWYEEVPFGKLNEILESIPLDGIPGLEGLELEPPHRKLMPYVVEGYHLPDQDFKAIDILPKGVEIRTPVCTSLSECLSVFQVLHTRLQKALHSQNLRAVALSHHPIATEFKGPQNKRRHDFWMWAMEVMTTYGPDINLGVPESLMREIDFDDFQKKINYYAPAMTAFSVAAPFRNGDLWKVRGQVGKSLRTYRRSVVAPPIEIHPDENNRLEFKVFDMSTSLNDYQNFFLLFITLLMDGRLKGRASNATRIYDQGSVARFGFEAEEVRSRAHELLQSAQVILPPLGFSPQGLQCFEERLSKNLSPADEMISLFHRSGGSLAAVLEVRSQLTQ